VTVDTPTVDAIASAWFAARLHSQPGLAYGVVSDGKLVHSGGLGDRRAGRPAPRAGASSWRLKSMVLAGWCGARSRWVAS
jgi:CubicO group peptidase (beta-lactamase class C family)